MKNSVMILLCIGLILVAGNIPSLAIPGQPVFLLGIFAHRSVPVDFASLRGPIVTPTSTLPLIHFPPRTQYPTSTPKGGPSSTPGTKSGPSLTPVKQSGPSFTPTLAALSLPGAAAVTATPTSTAVQPSTPTATLAPPVVTGAGGSNPAPEISSDCRSSRFLTENMLLLLGIGFGLLASGFLLGFFARRLLHRLQARLKIGDVRFNFWSHKLKEIFHIKDLHGKIDPDRKELLK